MMLSIILICSEREAENRTTADYLKRELPSMPDQAELLVSGHGAQQEAWLDELAQVADVSYMQIGERTDAQLYADAMNRLKGELATALYGGDTCSDGAFARIAAEAAKREKKQVFIMRIFIVVFIAISAVIAVVQYKSGVTFIAQLMGISWGALAGAFFAPFIYSLYWKGVTKAAVLVNFLFGSGIMVANMLARASFPTVLQSPINCGAFAMLAGLIIVPVVSLITPKLSDEKKQAVFSCYEK